MEKITAVYARTSPVIKPDSMSLEDQLAECSPIVGTENVKEYIDDGYSGKTMDRPQVQQLIQDVEAGLIGCVVVAKLDRIARNVLDFAKLMDAFQRNDVKFCSAKERFDSTTPYGRAELFSCMVFEQLKIETKAAKK